MTTSSEEAESSLPIQGLLGIPQQLTIVPIPGNENQFSGAQNFRSQSLSSLSGRRNQLTGRSSPVGWAQQLLARGRQPQLLQLLQQQSKLSRKYIARYIVYSFVYFCVTRKTSSL